MAAGAQEPSLRERIETELSNPRGGSVERADHFAAEWGSQSVPIMLELLEDPAFRESEAKILVYIAAARAEAGVAYRAAPRGIERIADLRIEFRRDGTYRLDSRSRLRPRNAPYWPRDEGPYFLLTERHLYLGRAWSDGVLSAAGIADVRIEGNRLSFTSFEDNAYFVFERE